MHTVSRHTVSRYAPARVPAFLLRLSLLLLLALSATAAHPAFADTTPPTIKNASISPTGTYAPNATLPTITITATVTDSGSGVDPNSVYASIPIVDNGNNYPSVQLSNGGSGNVYTGTIDLSQDYDSNTNDSSRVFTVQVRAYDNVGNQTTVTANGSITQLNDNIPPTISNAKITPSSGTYAPNATLPTITITATVTDTGTNATGVDPNSVYASIPIVDNGNNYPSVQLSNGGSGNVYTGTIDLSQDYDSNTNDSSRVFTVQVRAYDNVGNQTTVTANGSITQLNDNIPPKITNATVSPKFIANGGATVTLSANITDTGGNNTGVNNAVLAIYEDGSLNNYANLTKGSGSLYTGTFAIPAGDANPHTWTFAFTATDNVGNTGIVNRYAEQAGTATQPAPTLTSISPTEGFSGLTGTITLNGTGFTKYSVVLFDGFVVPAHFVSATKLTCSVDKSFLPAAKQVQVQVYNTPPGGGTTNGQTFTIKPRLSMLTLTPKAVTGGSTATATVTLAHAAFADQTVTLASNNTAVATVPASVVIPAGSSSATFPVTTTTVTTATAVKITAHLGPTTLAATLTVNPASSIASDGSSSVTTDGEDAP